MFLRVVPFATSGTHDAGNLYVHRAHSIAIATWSAVGAVRKELPSCERGRERGNNSPI